jgi:hypothetical protein
MADYVTKTKIIIGTLSPDEDSVAGSLAKEINDYIETLDDTSEAIIDIQATELDKGRIAYIVLHKTTA